MRGRTLDESMNSRGSSSDDGIEPSDSRGCRSCRAAHRHIPQRRAQLRRRRCHTGSNAAGSLEPGRPRHRGHSSAAQFHHAPDRSVVEPGRTRRTRRRPPAQRCHFAARCPARPGRRPARPQENSQQHTYRVERGVTEVYSPSPRQSLSRSNCDRGSHRASARTRRTSRATPPRTAHRLAPQR